MNSRRVLLFDGFNFDVFTQNANTSPTFDAHSKFSSPKYSSVWCSNTLFVSYPLLAWSWLASFIRWKGTCSHERSEHFVCVGLLSGNKGFLSLGFGTGARTEPENLTEKGRAGVTELNRLTRYRSSSTIMNHLH
jgi:hypothetical protein